MVARGKAHAGGPEYVNRGRRQPGAQTVTSPAPPPTG